MNKIIPTLAVSFFVMLTPTAVHAQSMKEKFDTMISKIFPEDQPGAAVLVLQEGKTIIREGFGLANLEQQKKVTPNTHFRMASVSKQFTAMCVLLLQKQGRLSINDPVSKYLEELPEFTQGITLKQLMTHTSGIADYENLIPKDQKSQVTDAAVLNMIERSDSLYFQPGTQFRYSNTGFCLLTQVVEKVSGMPYEQFIRQHIFLPLKMEHTVMYDKNTDIFERAYGYQKKDGTWKFGDQSITSATLGDGSVYTSVNEYENWIRALWNHELLNADSVSDPLKVHAEIKAGLEYGYGWFITREKDGSKAYFHSGESKGFHNVVYHNPSKKMLIIIFSNSDDDRVAKAFNDIQSKMNVQLEILPKGKSLFNFLSNIYGD